MMITNKERMTLNSMQRKRSQSLFAPNVAALMSGQVSIIIIIIIVITIIIIIIIFITIIKIFIIVITIIGIIITVIIVIRMFGQIGVIRFIIFVFIINAHRLVYHCHHQ